MSLQRNISGSDFEQVEGLWRHSLFFLSGQRLKAEEDEQMEGDETLLLDLEQNDDPRITLSNSLPARRDVNDEEVFPEAIITIVDNDFVTIAPDPDEHPDNPEVAEGEEIVFELTRPAGTSTAQLTVTVQIDEPQDADLVLEETAPFEKTVMFLAGEPMARLTVPTVDDETVESNAMVTAMVVFSPDYSALPGDDEYYNASSTPASVLVLADEATLVSITAVGDVGDSGLVEVDEGDEIVFELTHSGDPAIELTVTVAIAEPPDANRVLEDAPFTKTVMFPAGVLTTQLAVRTVSDEVFEPDTTVMATVLPAAVAAEEPGYYVVRSPRSASILVRDDDIPGINVYVASTQVRASEGSGFRLRVIAETLYDERPHYLDSDSAFGIAYSSEPRSAQVQEDFEPANEVVEIFYSEFHRVSKLVDEGVAFFYSQVVEFPALVTIDDDLMEGDESLLLELERTLNLPDQIMILSPEVELTIEDNDFVTIAPAPDTTIAIDPDTTLGVVAKGTPINFVLTRPAGDLASELPVRVITEVSGTAPSTQAVVFPAGASMAQLTVPPVDDAIVESDKTVTAVVLPLPPDSSVSPGDSEYYNASPTPASLLVFADDTVLVGITAVGAVGPSGLVEVDEGEELVFELTRTGDLSSPLTAVVGIDEAGGDILADSVRSTEAVVFLPDMPTAQLAVPTPGAVRGDDDDFDFEPHTTVTVVVVAAAVAKEDPGYYVVRLPESVSVLVRDNDIPGIDIYAASTRASVSEGSSFRLRVIADMLYDEGPRIFNEQGWQRY